jgi:uroporphyrinogen-III synthase
MRLDGRRIVVCRAHHQAGPLLAAIAAEGAEPIHVPLIEVVPPLDGGAALAAALSNADQSTWVAVTSANGVDAVARTFSRSTHDSDSEHASPEQDRSWRLAVVGRSTASRAEAWALGVDFESPEPSAAGLARSLPVSEGERVIAAVAELAGPDLPSILGDRGIEVEVVVAYRTVVPEISADDHRRIVDADLVFVTSPSVVERLQSSIGGPNLPPLVAIGSTTSAAMVANGLPVAETATSPSIDALIDAAVRSLQP